MEILDKDTWLEAKDDIYEQAKKGETGTWLFQEGIANVVAQDVSKQIADAAAALDVLNLTKELFDTMVNETIDSCEKIPYIDLLPSERSVDVKFGPKISFRAVVGDYEEEAACVFHATAKAAALTNGQLMPLPSELGLTGIVVTPMSREGPAICFKKQ